MPRLGGGDVDGYDAQLARWPVPVEPIDVPTRYGTIRVNACGPRDGRPLVLLPGYGTSSAYWHANVGAWARSRRVLAVDRLGDLGRSVYDGEPIRDRTGLMSSMDEFLDGLGLARVDLCGHSYGAWTSLRYALHAPERIGRIVLLDPTHGFTGPRLSYLARALPMVLRPTPGTRRRFLRWETGGAIDPQMLELICAPFVTHKPRRARLVLSRRPTDEELRSLAVPTLVLMAGRGRQNDNARLAATARRLVPDLTLAELPTATHHTIPFADAEALNRHVDDFLR